MDALAREVLTLSRNTLLVNLRFLDAALSQFAWVSAPGKTLLTDGKHIFTAQSMCCAAARVGARAFTDCPIRQVNLLGCKVQFGAQAFGENPDQVLLAANGGDIYELQPSIRDLAARGFAVRYLAGTEIAPEVKASCLKYIKGRRKSLWSDDAFLPVILQEKFISAKDVPTYVEEAAKLGRTELTAALLEYQNRLLSQKSAVKGTKQKS